MMKFRFLFYSLLTLAILSLAPLSGVIAANKYSIDNPPKVPEKYVAGMEKFKDLCSSCHGKWGNGTPQGPPLMHGFYHTMLIRHFTGPCSKVYKLTTGTSATCHRCQMQHKKMLMFFYPLFAGCSVKMVFINFVT